MLKATEYKLEDSNVEKLGGDEDRATKKKSALGEPAWRRHKEYFDGSVLTKGEQVKDAQGKPHHIEIWRIEKFKVKFWPRESHGQFYSGDSYIILHTFKEEDKIKWDLHFWLGTHTTQDEAGTAAYKTVELDTLLDDGPVQHREVQGHESELFIKLFTEILKCGGPRYSEGGVDSGFNHVEPEKFVPRLLHIKGRKKVRCVEVKLDCSSLNSGDIFIYDGGLNVISWTGKKAGMFEKNKNRELCDALKTERKGKPAFRHVREGENEADLEEFYKLVGGDVSSIKSAEQGGKDDEEETAAVNRPKKLYRLSDASGKMTFSQEAEGSDCKMNKLDEKDVFVFDVGHEIFVWVGSKASDKEKFECMHYAQMYLSNEKRPTHLPITRVLQNAENAMFKQYLN